MIVYVESNFILGIALDQEEEAAATEILGLAEGGRLEPAVPAFALCEPFERVTRDARVRRSLVDSLTEKVMAQLERSPTHQPLVTAIRPLLTAVGEIESRQMDDLESTLGRVVAAARQLAVTDAVFSQALANRKRHDLDIRDAIIYSNIVSDLAHQRAQTPKCFASRDKKAFFDPAIKEELHTHNCRYVERFDQALSFVRGREA